MPGRPAISSARLRAACRGPDRRTLGADLHAVAERPEADVDVDRDRDDRRASPDRELDQVELRGLVHHQDGRRAGLSRLELRQPRDRLPVGRRIGDEQVSMAGLGEHQGLRDREAEDALEARVARRDPLEHRAATHRLGGHPDRLAAGAGEHRVRVRVERVEIDECEGRLEALEDRLVSVVEQRRRPRPPSVFEPLDRAEPGEVAEWLKALAC